MEIRSRDSELSVISQVSTVEGCPLSGVPLYKRREREYSIRIIMQTPFTCMHGYHSGLSIAKIRPTIPCTGTCLW